MGWGSAVWLCSPRDGATLCLVFWLFKDKNFLVIRGLFIAQAPSATLRDGVGYLLGLSIKKISDLSNIIFTFALIGRVFVP